MMGRPQVSQSPEINWKFRALFARLQLHVRINRLVLWRRNAQFAGPNNHSRFKLLRAEVASFWNAPAPPRTVLPQVTSTQIPTGLNSLGTPIQCNDLFRNTQFVWHLIRNYVRIRVEGIRIETKRIETVMMPPNSAAKISETVKTGVVIIIW